MKKDDFDTILTKLGTGKWNMIFLVAMCYWYSLLPYHVLAGVFLAPAVDHTCHLPPHAHSPTLILPPDAAHTPDNTSYTSQPTEPSVKALCSFLVKDAATGRLEEEPCTEWDFDNSTFVSTVTSEFQLVCERKNLRATYQSMYMIGMLVGSFFNGYLADRFGRYTIVVISTVIYSLIAIISAWLPSMPWILAARFMLGTMHPTSLVTGYILVMETTEIKMRAPVGVVQFITWSLATMLYSGWAYLLREWRWLQTAVSLPSLLFIPFLFLMGESPRWLAVVGQHKRALKELRRAAAWNKVILPPDQELLAIMQRIQEQASTNKNQSTGERSIKSMVKHGLNQVFILFRTPRMRLVTVVMCIDFFVVALLFFGLTLGGSAIGVDLFIYVAISGAVELPSSSILFPLLSYFGRRKMAMASYFLVAVVLLTQPIIPDDLKWLSVTLVMLGKMGSTCAFTSVGLYVTELTPTEVRSQGLGAAYASSRGGAIIAPYIIYAVEKNHPWVISVVFGLAALVAGLVILPLWETRDSRMPDTLAELEGTITPSSTADGRDNTNYVSTESTTKKNDAADVTTPF